METKLLPCPFCGTKDNRADQDTDGAWYVQCYMCSVWQGETHATEAEAIEAWNTRI